MKPPPFDRKSTEAFVRKLKVRAAVVLDDVMSLAPMVETSFKDLAIPIVFARQWRESDERNMLEIRVVGSDGSAGGHNEAMRVHRDQFDDATAEKIVELLVPLAGQNRKWNNRHDRRITRWLTERLFRVVDNRRIAATLGIRRIDTLDALAADLA